jgi:hypothetical protein
MTRQAVLRKRLQIAIDAIFDGNVTAAAAGLGLSQPTLHKIVAGKIGESKSSTIARLADQLGVTESWLGGNYEPEIDGPLDLGDVPSGSIGLKLIANYSDRHTRDRTEWIERITAPRTEPGRRILEAYRAWMYRQPSEEFVLLNECWLASTEAHRTAGKGPRVPAEELATYRAQTHFKLAMLDFVIATLRRLGESPTHKAS